MIPFSYQETIAAPVDAVFAAMSEITGFDRWLDMDGRPRDQRATDVGTSFDSTGRLGPLKVEFVGEVTTYEPGRAFGFHLRNPRSIDFTLELRLEPGEGGTQLFGSGTLATHGLWRLVEPLLRSEVPKGEAREAARLKALVEGAAGTPA